MNSSLADLWARRHLLRVLVASNLKRQNKSSALGYLWWFLDPLLLMGVYYLVVVVLFQRAGANQPFLLFLICGLIPWKAFSDSISQSVPCIVGAQSIVKAISFPKAVLPISLVLSNSIYFFIAMLVAVAMALAYGPSHGTWPGPWYLVLPLVFFSQFLVTLGLALALSAIGLFFADTKNIVGHILRVMYFLSPGLYAISRVPERYQTVYRLNPFAGLMTSYRDIIMFDRLPQWIDLLYPLGCGAVLTFIGFRIFRHYEGRFVQHL